MDERKKKIVQYHRRRVGRDVQAVREQKGMSREELAEKSGVTVLNVRKVEEGRYNVPMDVLTLICEALDYEVWIGFKF